MDDDLISAAHAAQENSQKPAYHPTPRKPSRFPKKALVISVAVVLLLLVGGFSVWQLILNKPKTLTPTVNSSATVIPPEATNDISNAPISESYTSTALSVGFKYPKSWKVSETAGGIRIDSPQFSFPAANLGSTKGIFRIYIRQGARTVDGKYIGAGIALKPSEKLIYTQPAVGQRADTLLSFFGNNSPDVFTFFMIAGNFQLKQGDTLGPNYGKEPDSYIVAGGYTTTTAVDDLAMSSVALDYYATTTAYKQALAIIGSLQLQ
jgi:hypothetical protein